MARWQVFSAVALRRLPTLMPRKDIIQEKVQHIFNAWEDSNSRYSKHEMQHLEDIRTKDEEETVIAKETAQDQLDRWVKEKSSFKFSENYDSSLAQTHYLFKQIKFGTDIKEQWLLPQALFDRDKGDCNLYDTARRALQESLDIINGFRIVSKVPSCVYTFRYPKKIANLTGHDGAKVFFLKAQLDHPSGSVLEALDDKKNPNLKWLTRNDAMRLVHKRYMASFSQGLLHEDRVDVDKVLRKAADYAKSSKRAAVYQ